MRFTARTTALRKGDCPALGLQSGAVLMEVVLALALFVAAATVITGGLNASVRGVERLRANTHANNLAASILAEMQIGLIPVEPSGPNAFDPPFEDWSWEAKAEPADDASLEGSLLQRVEIIVRSQSQPVVRRLVEFLPVSPAGAATNSTTAVNSLGGSPAADANP